MVTSLNLKKQQNLLLETLKEVAETIKVNNLHLTIDIGKIEIIQDGEFGAHIFWILSPKLLLTDLLKIYIVAEGIHHRVNDCYSSWNQVYKLDRIEITHIENKEE